MKFKLIQKITLVIVLSLALASCSILGGGKAPVDLQADVEGTLNAIATQSFATLSSQFTQTAASLPTDTPYPTPAPVTATPLPATATPVPTSTPFPTFIVPTLPPPLPTMVPSVTVTTTSTAYSCQVLSQSPWLGKGVVPGYDFDMHWIVKNTGTSTWDQNNVDLRYASGTKFQKFADAVDFSKTVKSGEQIDLAVDMVAPTAYGIYSGYWNIVQSDKVICTVEVQVWVK